MGSTWSQRGCPPSQRGLVTQHRPAVRTTSPRTTHRSKPRPPCNPAARAVRQCDQQPAGPLVLADPGTTSAELLRKLNEQRDIIALMEVKMKEMKATIRQLRVAEAKLQEEYGSGIGCCMGIQWLS
ncbi:hypothetical protein INR49_016363, partial [Caranx melampygus]